MSSILRSSDLAPDRWVALLEQAPWPKEAYIWAEWIDRAWLGRVQRLKEEVQRLKEADHPLKDSLHVRIFWKDGELRWKRLDRGVYRVVYLGEDAAYAPTELDDASLELRNELERSPSFVLPDSSDENNDSVLDEDETGESNESFDDKDDVSDDTDDASDANEAPKARGEASSNTYHVELQQLSLCSKDLLAEQGGSKKRLHLEVRMYKNPSGESCFERYAALRWR